MARISIFCFFAIVSISLAAIENTKRGGHGLFNSLNGDVGKSNRLEEPKIIGNIENSKLGKETKIDDTLTISIVPENKNPLLDNSDTNLRHNSLYLQPEPRGLQYLLNSRDYNPYVLHYAGKRDLRNIHQFRGEPNHNGQNKCDGRRRMCFQRKRRYINLQPGNVIPGSRGQAVLYGVPNGDSGSVVGSNYQFQGVPYKYQNSDMARPGDNNYRYPNWPQQDSSLKERLPPPDIQHYGGYKTYGY